MIGFIHTLGPVAVAIIASIVVHELGHVLFGCIVRHHVQWLAVGPFIIFRNGKITCRWKHKYFGGAVFLFGESIKNKKTYQKEKGKSVVILLGGPITSFLAGFVFLNFVPHHEYSLYFGIFSLLIGAVTLLFTDGPPALLILTNRLYAKLHFLNVELLSYQTEKPFDFLLKELGEQLHKVKADSIEKMSLTSLSALFFYLYCAQIEFDMSSRKKLEMFQHVLKELEDKGLGSIRNKQKRSLLNAIVYLEEMNLFMENNKEAAAKLYSKLADKEDNRLNELKRGAVINHDDKAKELYISELNSDIFNRHTLLVKIEEQFIQKAKEHIHKKQGSA
ncbi:site-2 protease family protein [Bacillus swezeyi]|uniref:site-2 protease family protein n=1 Tax=Bacillus swezeyi TaxID=1925020 RepID=UPI002E1E612E|nr:site-2 protease family protein [Bacillus swezeyi]